MDYISDSDGDNSLPVLSPECVDRDQLRSIFHILSAGSRARICRESKGTPMEKLYEELDRERQDDMPEGEIAEADTSLEELFDHLAVAVPSSPTLNALISGLDRTSELTQLLRQQDIEAALAADLGNSVTSNPVPSRISGRSLRKRTFASRHPYIADQADWLGICTVDSINEMFTDDEDVTKVVRALNQLYLKRKKRYPDEDRYKAKNFYAHLGKSKLLALTGDQDLASRDKMEETLSQDADEEEYETDGKEDDSEEQLIPYEGLSQPTEQVEFGEAELSSEASDGESSEEEQLIKIGGKYRQLSRILRGVLPESARRLSMFLETKLAKAKRNKRRQLEPRKGLAIKKYGSASAQSAELQRELNSFIDENQSPEDYTPNHEKLLQRPISDFSVEQQQLFPVSEFSSSSDSDSDSVEEVFSDNVRGNMMPSFSITKTDPYQSFIDVDSDSAQEMDHINYMFANRAKKSAKSRLAKTTVRRQPSSSRHASLPSLSRLPSFKSHTAALRDLTNLPRKKRNRGSSHSASSTLKRRKLTSPMQSRTRPVERATPGKSKSIQSKPNTPSSNSRNETEKTSRKHLLQRSIDFKRAPMTSTTVFEVESATRFVQNRPTREVGHPESYIPSKELLFGSKDGIGHISLLPYNELQKVNTIGDGHIFFSGENDVSFMLVGKSYSFGLYRLEASVQQTERYFMHLRKLVLDSEKMLNPKVRNEIHHSLKLMVKWILIARRSPPDSLWRHLNHCLTDFTKLHTRQMRQHQLVIHAQLLFIYYIYTRIEGSRSTALESQFRKAFDALCSDYWSVLFQSFSVFEFSKAYSESNDDLLSDSILLMYLMFNTREQLWWDPMIDALQDSALIIEDKCSLLDMIYVLASLVPQSKFNWGCFLAVLSQLKADKYSLVFHHFIDICVLATQRLSWPLEERVITHFYSAFAQRKFGNFSDESLVPPALGTIHSRLDIPESSVFGRFMGLLYTYISDLNSKKEVKRLVLKLVASSQYQHQSGRKYQVQFVNRVNLVSLLLQVSNIDLSTPFISIVELIAQSKDMFIYGRTFEVLTLFCNLAIQRGTAVPLQACRILLEKFCEYYDSLFGMPDLLMRAIQFVGTTFQCQRDAALFDLMKDINLSKFPDAFLSDLLSVILISSFDVSARQDLLTRNEIEPVASFQKGLISFIGAQMGRLSLLEKRRQETINEAIEIGIQIWMMTASITGTQHWNVIMLQRYPYIGNSELREHFVQYMCEEYMKSGPLDDSIIGEIDMIMVRGLTSFTVSRYALPLYSRLSRTPHSIFCFKKNLSLNLNSLVELQTLRSQLLASVIQNVLNNSPASGDKISLIKSMVMNLGNEFSKNYSLAAYVDFCKQMLDVIQEVAKSVLANVDEFWNLSDKLGTSNRKKQLAWSESSEIDRLQNLNSEFLNSLQFGKDLKPALDNWISIGHFSTVYSLVQLYISAIALHESHWAHLSLLLRYVFQRLEQYQIRTQDTVFKSFLDMLVDVATMSSRWENDNYVIFQLDALVTCSKMFQHAFYVYDGYMDQADFLLTAEQFIDAQNVPASKDFEPKSHFTNVKFGMLRNSIHSTYSPPFQHTRADYLKAHEDQDTHLNELKKTIHSDSVEVGNLDFHFDF